MFKTSVFLRVNELTAYLISLKGLTREHLSEDAVLSIGLSSVSSLLYSASSTTQFALSMVSFWRSLFPSSAMLV